MQKAKYFNAKEYKNMKEIIYNSANEYKDNIAFIIKNKEDGGVKYQNITYKQFLDDINYLGSALYSLNMQNKRIAVIGKNRYEWILTHLSNLLGGIVSVPLDKDLQLEELENSLVRSKVDAIVFDSKLLELVEEIKQRGATNITKFICMDEKENYISVAELLKKGKEIIESGNLEYIDYKIDNDAMNVLLFTSGTTSKSKAVMLSHKNLASNIYALQRVEDIRQTDTNIAILPFHHIFGSVCMLAMLTLRC